MDWSKPVTVAVLLAMSTPLSLAQTPVLSAVQDPEHLSSRSLVGASVYNTANENIGHVEDLIISSSGVISIVVIGVGGFLGIGEKKVAIPFSALHVDKGDNNLTRVVIHGTKASLTAMPAFAYAKS